MPARRLALMPALLALVAGTAGARAAELPAPLHGVWQGEGGSTLVVGGNSVDSCRATGLRAITPSRWYVDLACGEAERRLDLVLLDADRLLVAERPLGEATFHFRRRPEAGAARG